jgi:hypothetical protein
VVVNAEVWESTDAMVPPWPWNTLSSCPDSALARSVLERQISVADEILVTHRRPGALRQREALVDGEDDRHGAVLVQGHVADLADLDTGDADEVAALESRDVGEDGAVAHPRVEPKLTEDGHQGEHEDQADSSEECDPRQGA